jgi:hypothetical protein
MEHIELLEACWNKEWAKDLYCVEEMAEHVLRKNFRRCFVREQDRSHAYWLRDRRSKISTTHQSS